MACRSWFSLCSFSPVASRHGTQIAGLGRKCLYPLNYLSDFRIKPGVGRSPFFELVKINLNCNNSFPVLDPLK